MMSEQASHSIDADTYADLLFDLAKHHDIVFRQHMTRMETLRLLVFSAGVLALPRALNNADWWVVLLLPLPIFAVILNGLHALGEVEAIAAHKEEVEQLLDRLLHREAPREWGRPTPWATAGGKLRANSRSRRVVHGLYSFGTLAVTVFCLGHAFTYADEKWWVPLIGIIGYLILIAVCFWVWRDVQRTQGAVKSQLRKESP
jgi:hypothetical protein